MRRIIIVAAFVAAIGFINGAVTCNHGGSSNEQPLVTSRASLKAAREALEAYQRKNGTYPTQLKDVNDLQPRWFRRRIVTVDAWGTPLRFRIVDGNPIVTSAGPDRQCDTADDLHCSTTDRQTRGDAHPTSDDIRPPADGSPKPSM